MTDPYLLIGVAGEAGVGKTTVVDYLRGAHRFRCTEVADRVEEVCRAMGWDGQRDDRGCAFLQTVDAAGRAYDPDTGVVMTDAWVQQMIVKETANQSAGMEYDRQPRICVGGIRFQNEAEWLLSRGGLLLYVTRANNPDGLTGDARMHESEVAARHLGEWLEVGTPGLPAGAGDAVSIDNAGDIIELRWLVATILHTWRPSLFPHPPPPPVITQ